MFWTVFLGFIPEIFGIFLSNKCHPTFYNNPECVDEPVGYYCNCGPGFKWNSVQCIAAGVDSKMVFQSVNSSYTYVGREMLPREFSIALWVRPRHPGVLMSMVHDNMKHHNSSQLTINLELGFNSNFFPVIRYTSTTWQAEWQMEKPIAYDRWSHIIWSQKKERGQLQWIGYINGEYRNHSLPYDAETLKGQIILGQLSKSFKGGLNDLGFAGDMAHFHIWNYSMTENEMKLIHKDCIYNYCGNVVQWSDFRYGTRGNLVLKWPSGLTAKPCANTSTLIQNCDSSCSRRIGAQCKVDIKANVEWERTKANTTISNPCPMLASPIRSSDNSSMIMIDTQPSITRYCRETSSQEGKWEEPNSNSCISQEWRILRKKKNELQYSSKQCILNDADLIEGLSLFVNLTEKYRITNAIDLSLCVSILDVLTMLKVEQESNCPRFVIEISLKKEEIHQNQYAIMKLVVKIASNLLDSKNSDGWNFTKPSGFEGRKLLGVLSKFYQITTENVNNLINKYFYMPREMYLLINHHNIIFKLKAFRWSDFKGTSFPDFDDISEYSDEWKSSNQIATIALSKDFLFDKDQSQIFFSPKYIVIIAVIYRDAALKASYAINQDRMKMSTGSMPSWNQRINADIIDISASIDGRNVEDITPKSLKIHFMYKDFFNISNTSCLSVAGDFRQSNIYLTTRSSWANDCYMEHSKTKSVVCVCDRLGIFTVATDMFNEMWKRLKKPNNILGFPSYFGCTVSAILCSISLIMLIYLRTSSNTSSIHKHFSMAIIASQISYMFGIDKYEYETVCKIFSLSLHYFFLSCFTWLMNEAFNLYIVITYAAHSHGDSTDGHMWRFYLLGWIMPGILVAAVAGINRKDYQAKNMCWINQKDVWLFYGPAITVIAVSILVLIFTAKEHHESSYTKNEKDNKAIINQTKAIWTQIILLTLSWSFAFICVRLQGSVVMYLYGLFNSLQGAFYIVFYYLLNDEVQNIYSDRKNKDKNRKASGQGDDIPYVCYTDSYHGNDGQLDSSQMHDITDDSDALNDRRRRSFFSNVIENFNIRGRKSPNKNDGNDRSNNDNSDYELITSV